MRTVISILVAVLVISCTTPAQSRRLDAVIARYVPSVSVNMNATDFLRVRFNTRQEIVREA